MNDRLTIDKKWMNDRQDVSIVCQCPSIVCPLFINRLCSQRDNKPDSVPRRQSLLGMDCSMPPARIISTLPSEDVMEARYHSSCTREGLPPGSRQIIGSLATPEDFSPFPSGCTHPLGSIVSVALSVRGPYGFGTRRGR